MLNHLKKIIYFSILFCGLGFSSLSHGNVEVSAFFGGNWHHSDLELSGITQNTTTWPNQTPGISFDMGGDILYRLPMQNRALGLGLRYGHTNTFVGKEHQDASENPTQGREFKFNAHRIALLANYRFLNNPKGLLLGGLVEIGVFRMTNYTETLNENDDLKLSHNQFWPPAFAVAIEAGWRINPKFHVKAEIGYRYHTFGGEGLECEGNACTGAGVDTEGKFSEDANSLNLSAIYGTLGIGFYFG